MTDLGPDPRQLPPVLSSSEAEALALRHDLQPVGRRPGLLAYLEDVWRHRHLMWTLAKGEFVAQHQDNYLGLIWAVINPILLAVAYFLIFGILIPTRGGVDNFVAFLTIGLFTFIPLSVAMVSGSKSLLRKMGMMRSLTFPRVILPITVVLAEFVATLPAFVVLVLIVLARETPTLSWLLYPFALLIVMGIGLGIAMIGARLVHAVRDAANLMPLLTRLLRYVSGIFFSVEHAMSKFNDPPELIALALQYQPFAISLTLVRETLMSEFPMRWETWAVAGGWAVVLLLVGFLTFWRGEGSYGRA